MYPHQHLKEGTFTGATWCCPRPGFSIPRLCGEGGNSGRSRGASRLLGFSFVLILPGAWWRSWLRASASGGAGSSCYQVYPEIGTDVDKPSDLELAQRLMGAVRDSQEV